MSPPAHGSRSITTAPGTGLLGDGEPMVRLPLALLLLAGCAHQSRTQTGYSPVAAGAITEQQSHTTALLQAVSAVDDSVVWVAGHGATWVRTVDGGRSWVPGAMTGPDSALQFRDVEAVSTTTAY